MPPPSPPSPPQGAQVRPGFEFDAAAPRTGWTTRPLSPDPFSPGLFSADHFNAPPFRPGPGRPGPHQPRIQQKAGTEWTRLLRSFVPEPAKRTWFKQFLSALEFRGLALRGAVLIMTMIVLGVAAVVIAGASSGGDPGQAAPPAALGFPPATLAAGQFTAAASGRGISQTLGQVASDGAEIVAVGSQTGARIARAQFFVSTDAGATWAMGTVRTPAGGPPPPGYAASFVAGGNGAWVALGPNSIWTSPDGRTWTLASTAGLPLRPGDQISVLERTAAGFIAVGANVPASRRAQAQASPVVFLSANGLDWQRLGAQQLRLAAGAAHVEGLSAAAVYGSRILITGDVTVTAGRPGRTRTVPASAAWLSTDGGTTWTLAVPPAGPGAQPLISGAQPQISGAQPQISGVAATGSGFVLLRPATVAKKPAVDVYRSPNGTAWTFAATLTTPAGFTAGLVNGAQAGAVVTGQAGQALTAFVTANGASWRQDPAFGPAAAEAVSGVAITSNGTAIAAGTTAGDPDSRQPLLTLLSQPSQVAMARIPGAVDPELAVNAVAASSGMQVAVGSANGFPAAWTSVNGGSSWQPAVGQTPAVLDRPGIQQLTSVTHGAAGWLAVGNVTAAAAEHPVVLASPDGQVWSAADGAAAFTQNGLYPEQAVAGTNGYVIVGYQVTGGRTIAAAWWSADLAGWQRGADAVSATGGPGALDGPSTSRQMLAVTAGPHGFVAVGSAGDGASAWTSANGQAWTEVNLPLPAGTTRTVLNHAASRGQLVVAVGTALTASGQQVPFAARSSDGGATWTESTLPVSTLPESALTVPAGHATVTALTAAGNEFIATGTFGATPGHQDVVVWTSASGSAWKTATPGGQGLTGPGIQAITALTTSGDTVTGVGFSASAAGEEPVFWQWPIR